MAADIIQLFIPANDEILRARRIIARAMKVLKRPLPDTFLGNKTQQPFSKETRPTAVVYMIEARKPYRS